MFRPIKRMVVIIATLALVSTAQAQTVYNIPLTEAEEVPPSGSVRTGSATLTLNASQTELSYLIELLGFDLGGFTVTTDDDLTGAHIHDGDFGTNGPIVFSIFNLPHDVDDVVINATPTLITMSGVWDAADELTGAEPLASQLADLLNGGLYMNIHTNQFPGGDIRGQIPEPGSLLLAISGFFMVTLLARRPRS